MTSVLGHLSLALSCGLAVLLMITPIRGVLSNNGTMIRSARPLAYLLLATLLVAMFLLIYGLLTDDFSIMYVAANSNSALPYYYKIAASWGAHEGSLLLWSLLLAGWTVAVARPRPEIGPRATLYVLSVMGFVNLGFLLFITLTSNPFTTILPIPIEGRDLNPLLQDIGLILHPPLLYMGYVGFSVAFAFAIAALLIGRFDTQWIRWFRPWVLLAWVFLTIGILLGSLWAYRELGWGGWWFWDPVENSSLMPWIVGTALLHSVLVSQKRGIFKIWTLLLAITTFSLCLIGTFLVRSGVLVSVHAFSSDPNRGIYILLFLTVVIGGSFLLFASRGHKIINNNTGYAPLSKDAFIMGGNVVFLTAMLVVFLGTLFPLVYKQISGDSISVGAPFFNSMFFWLMIPFAFLLGLSPLLRWQKDEVARVTPAIIVMLLFSILWAIIFAVLIPQTIYTKHIVTMFMVGWVVAGTLLSIFKVIKNASKTNKVHTSTAFWGMSLAHLGVAMLMFGTSYSDHYQLEKTDVMRTGQTYTVGEYQFAFKSVQDLKGPNYRGERGTFEVTKHNQHVATLHPERRIYNAQKAMPMTEVAIHSTPLRDIYIALSDKQPDGSNAIRIHYKPSIFWIWVGGLMATLGGFIALFRSRSPYTAPQPLISDAEQSLAKAV